MTNQTTPPSAPENGQAALTASEVAALTNIHLNKFYAVSLPMIDRLVELGLAGIRNGDEYYLSDKGANLLGNLVSPQAQAAEPKADTVTALREFVEKVSRTWPDNLGDVLSARLLWDFSVEARLLLAPVSQKKDNDKKPETITAAQWDIVADAFEQGKAVVRDYWGDMTINIELLPNGDYEVTDVYGERWTYDNSHASKSFKVEWFTLPDPLPSPEDIADEERGEHLVELFKRVEMRCNYLSRQSIELNIPIVEENTLEQWLNNAADYLPMWYQEGLPVRQQPALATAGGESVDTTTRRKVTIKEAAQIARAIYEETQHKEHAMRTIEILEDALEDDKEQHQKIADLQAENERLSAQVAALTEALRPFAGIWNRFKNEQGQTISEEGGLSWGDWYLNEVKRFLDATYLAEAHKQAAEAVLAPTALTRQQQAAAGLKITLEGIALNAPQAEPQLFASNANYAIADSYYTADKLATAALTAYEAATGQPAIGDGEQGAG